MITILSVIKIIFWGSMLLVAYTYVGYPLLIAVWARFGSRKIQRELIKPTVSIIISAYNEEAHIAAKLVSCFKLYKEHAKIWIREENHKDTKTQRKKSYGLLNRELGFRVAPYFREHCN